jgi:hypothetical protein
MRTMFIFAFAAISMAACTTTKREEVRNDIENLEEQREELQAAERDGSIEDVREARQDVQRADRELQSNQKELYRPGAEGVAVVALKIGQSDPGDMSAVPQQYQAEFRDNDRSYYRSDGRTIYQIRSSDRVVTSVHPITR